MYPPWRTIRGGTWVSTPMAYYLGGTRVMALIRTTREVPGLLPIPYYLDVPGLVSPIPYYPPIVAHPRTNCVSLWTPIPVLTVCHWRPRQRSHGHLSVPRRHTLTSYLRHFPSRDPTFSALNGHFRSKLLLGRTSTLYRHSAAGTAAVLWSAKWLKSTGTHFLAATVRGPELFYTFWQVREPTKKESGPTQASGARTFTTK